MPRLITNRAKFSTGTSFQYPALSPVPITTSEATQGPTGNEQRSTDRTHLCITIRWAGQPSAAGTATPTLLILTEKFRGRPEC